MPTSIDDWLDELRSVVPGGSEDIARLALKATIREFYTKSGAWIQTIENIDVSENNALVYLDTAVGDGFDAKVMSIINVKYNDTVLRPQHHLKRIEPTGVPREYYPIQTGIIQLIPTPSETVEDVVSAEVSLAPKFTTNDVPNDTKHRWFDVVLDGVLGRLYSQPNKTYTNLVQGNYHLRRFRAGISEARDVGRRRYTNTENSWNFPAWN